jgi:hypothetical protein
LRSELMATHHRDEPVAATSDFLSGEGLVDPWSSGSLSTVASGFTPGTERTCARLFV